MAGITMIWLGCLLLLSQLLSIADAIKQPKKKASRTSLSTLKDLNEDFAVVTLVTGANSGYAAGATALGQSLINVGNTWDRIAMVTSDVTESERKEMSAVWEIVEVEPVLCNHKSPLDPTQYDLKGQAYQDGIKKWSKTCTKFRAWELTQYQRVVFMDSDLLVINSIDEVISEYSNASFLAAPEAFPPDNFNSGFMVIRPSVEGFKKLLELNEKVGSAEGGDQGVFNNGLCPKWFYADRDDPDCGRLPWIYNVPAAHYEKYNTLMKMSKLPPPAVIHFVADGKPWKVLMYEFVDKKQIKIPEHTLKELANQAQTHIMWRSAYYKAIKGGQPAINFLVDLVQNNGKIVNNDDDDDDDDEGVQIEPPKKGNSLPKPKKKQQKGGAGASGVINFRHNSDNNKGDELDDDDDKFIVPKGKNVKTGEYKLRPCLPVPSVNWQKPDQDEICPVCPVCSSESSSSESSSSTKPLKRVIKRVTKISE